MGAADEATDKVVNTLMEFDSASTRFGILVAAWKRIAAKAPLIEHMGALALVAAKTLPTPHENAVATAVAYRGAVAKVLEAARISGRIEEEMAQQRARLAQFEELVACGGDPPAPRLETAEDVRREMERLENPKKGQH